MVWEKTSVASSGLNFGRFLCHQDILKNILLVIVYNRGNMLPKLRIDCNTDTLDRQSNRIHMGHEKISCRKHIQHRSARKESKVSAIEQAQPAIFPASFQQHETDSEMRHVRQ